MNPDGADHCVVCSHEYYGIAEQEHAYDVESPEEYLDSIKDRGFQFWESSFERFIFAFWVENAVSFGDALPGVSEEQIQHF